MTFHELIRKRIAQKEKELERIKTLGEAFIRNTPDEKVGRADLKGGYKAMKRMTKDQLIRKNFSDLDIMFFNKTR